MMSTVAVVDDEADLREAVVEYLEGQGLRAVGAADGAVLREIAARETIDVAVLDIAMPGEDGLALARWLRAEGPRPGIIFATAAVRPQDRVRGLEIGADDYVTKPYDLRELLARIRSVLRRLPVPASPLPLPAPPPSGDRRVRLGAYVFDLGAHRLTGPDGQAVELTAAEAGLLEALVTRPNRVLSRAQLLALVPGREGDERSVDVRVARLRRKVGGSDGETRLIRTVRGEGYQFVPDPRA